MASIIRNQNLFCTCCGGEFKLSYPIKIDDLTARSDAFTKLHADCKQTYVEPTVDQSKSVKDKAAWWLANGERGLSSKTIWNCMMGNEHFEIHYPMDPDDFSRCWKLLEAVPEWKNQLVRLKDLSPTWSKLVDNWPRLTEFYEDMRKCKVDNGMYEFMDRIIRGK